MVKRQNPNRLQNRRFSCASMRNLFQFTRRADTNGFAAVFTAGSAGGALKLGGIFEKGFSDLRLWISLAQGGNIDISVE